MRRRLLPRSPLVLCSLVLLLLFLWSLYKLPRSDFPPPSSHFIQQISIDIVSSSPSPNLVQQQAPPSPPEILIPDNLESYLNIDDLFHYYRIPNDPLSPAEEEPYSSDLHQYHDSATSFAASSAPLSSACTMETCFNFDRCASTSPSGGGPLKVYVYPLDKFVPISSTYEKILNRILSSHYYTNDPEEACLFVLSIDTLDRDELSHDYVRNVATRLKNLPYWNNGENHLIFNLYAGTWPSYNETELNFPVGRALLAKASMSLEQFRPNFDISLPLFHPTHPEKGDDLGVASGNEFPTRKKHILAFKGKRYVYGIGSETRDSVYHLHNRNDVIMVTTCRHGKNWKEMKDERCDEDNKEYDKYDYEVLLTNSTFCLVPRGRRLGSFRFLETLKFGCIPVVLSNGWILPFSEVIDWPSAAVIGDERQLFQILDVVRSIPQKKIFWMRQQTQVIWNQYLSSVERIVETTFEIIRDRIQRWRGRDLEIWNGAPGALNYDMSFADTIDRFPFGHQHQEERGLFGEVDRMRITLRDNFTAVIYVHRGEGNKGGYTNQALFRLVKNAGRSRHVSKIIVMWNSNRQIPRIWPEVPIPLKIKEATSNTVSQRFLSDEEIETDAIFSLDEEIMLGSEEMDFAYQTWKLFPERLIGYQSRGHYWDEPTEMWHYSSKWTNDYSLILTGASIYHAYYNHLYWIKVPPAALLLVESLQNCEDIVMNFLIVRTTRQSPIKLTWKKWSQSYYSGGNTLTNNAAFQQQQQQQLQQLPQGPLKPPGERFRQRHTCLNDLADIFGSMPLKRSSVRLDPVLFQDPVSNLRKKYRQIEPTGG